MSAVPAEHPTLRHCVLRRADRGELLRHFERQRRAARATVFQRAQARRWSWWGRVIFYADVDALYGRALAAGYQPTTVPRDAEWGERYFHLIDPDGHELSFARPLLSSV